MSNRAPGEVLVQEWKGSTAEKALVSIHPERFEDVQQVALSTLFVIGNETLGSRRNLGALALGVELNRETGDLQYTKDDKGQHAKTVLKSITQALGAIPQGFATMPEPKRAQPTKAQKYTCPACQTNIRASYAAPIQVLCLHANKPQFGEPPAQFALQVRQAKQAKASTKQPKASVAAPVVEQPKATRTSSNIENVMTAVRGGAAKVVHGRNFGAEASA